MNIAAYPKYESYNDSGIDGFGEIPAHWQVQRNFAIFRETKQPGATELPVLSVSIHSGVSREQLPDEENVRSIIKIEDRTAYKRVAPNDIAYNMMRAWQGGIGRVHVDGMVSPAYVVAKPNEGVCASYIERQFRSPAYISSMDAASKGITDFRKRLYWEDFRDLGTVLPPLPEQRAIAAFLDGKCATIDEAVRIKEEQIRLLAERRQILIQQAVTRGLTPDAPMKDSGIDWIGQIPAHWSLAKLKFLTNKIVDGTHFTPEYLDEGIPFLRVTDLSQIKEGKIQWDGVRRISASAHKELSKRASAEFGDVLLSKNGTIGLTKVIDWQDEFSFFVSLCLIKLRSELNSHYFEAFFNSPLVDQQLFFGSFRTSVTNLHLERIKELLIVVPPIKEQRELVEHIRELSSPLDEAITLKKSQITALREYKTSLINAAVTGKIKVV
ncbi:restriction endonuclease subunit S [Rhodovulum sulfidophilum]|uniref:restriction endonuclease subunit S n=1 Tax=Rhodovulum sulfidophilum TaxID=35806 RepID=UPI001924A9DF|nr:restriction endonuclease subunit S [Rhodovulum sulfidophilum]MBL3574311.1 restriction endonuclease subunit S [Rhodovulum sulfidophilum]MCE8432458.1 restriction endonuclease subunit S [Rhodovulum sulfidophilum]MCF4115676.1 restriction endonuclease subunit S [Rhodovulum sulfidophilum]